MAWRGHPVYDGVHGRFAALSNRILRLQVGRQHDEDVLEVGAAAESNIKALVVDGVPNTQTY